MHVINFVLLFSTISFNNFIMCIQNTFLAPICDEEDANLAMKHNNLYYTIQCIFKAKILCKSDYVFFAPYTI